MESTHKDQTDKQGKRSDRVLTTYTHEKKCLEGQPVKSSEEM